MDDAHKEVQGGSGTAGGPAGVAGGSPPLTNRGVETPIDYLSLSIHDGQISEHWPEVVEALGLEGKSGKWLCDSGFKARGYQHLLYGPYGSALKVGSYKGNHENFEGKGEFFTAFDPVTVHRFLNLLVSIGSRYTCPRIDIKRDYCPFTPHQVRRAIKKGQVRTRLDRDSLYWHHSMTGSTVQLGSGYGTRIRCYDMRGYTRFEVQQRSDKAAPWLGLLLASPPGTWLAVAVSLIRDVIDFVEASDRPERAPLLPWWAEFVNGVEKAGIRAPTKPAVINPFERFAELVRERYAPVVRMYCELTGEDAEHVVYGERYTENQQRRFHLLQKQMMEAERYWTERGKPLAPYQFPAFS